MASEKNKLNPTDHNFTSALNFKLETVASLPAETDAYRAGRAVWYGGKPWFLKDTGSGLAWVSWDDVSAAAPITDIAAANDYVVVVTAAGNVKKIKVDDFAKRFETITIYARDFLFNQYDSLDYNENKEFNTAPYQKIRWCKFPNATSNTTVVHINEALPDNYSGGDVKIKFCFVTGSNIPIPETDKVYFKIAGRFDQNAVSLNRSLPDDVSSSTGVGAPNVQYISDVISLTPSTAAAGAGDLHLRIRRDCSPATNYAGDVYLRWVMLKYPVNKLSS